MLGTVIEIELILTPGNESICLVAAVARHIENIQSCTADRCAGELGGLADIMHNVLRADLCKLLHELKPLPHHVYNLLVDADGRLTCSFNSPLLPGAEGRGILHPRL